MAEWSTKMKAKEGVQPPTSPKIRRFPRLPEGLDMTKLAKSVWACPTFKPKEVKGVTTFIFSISLRSKIRSHNRHVYNSLFKSGGPVWTAALQKAYISAHSGKKRVAEYIDTMLYTVFRDALQILMEDAKTLAKKYDDMSYRSFDGKDHPALLHKIVENEAIIFALTSRREKGRKRVRQIDESRQIRLAKRHATLEPQVNLLRQSVDALKAKGVKDENTMKTEIGEVFKGHDWINHIVNSSAFLELPQNETATATTQSSLGGEWTPEQLIMGILKCEEKMLHRGRPLSVITIRKMITHGKKLLTNSEAAHK
jgi:hypothetical protein